MLCIAVITSPLPLSLHLRAVVWVAGSSKHPQVGGEPAHPGSYVESCLVQRQPVKPPKQCTRRSLIAARREAPLDEPT